jgi:hypothetical protein
VSPLADFSSLAPDEEKRFIPFERAMRENGRRAFSTGVAVAGALAAVLLFVCLGLYSPCNQFCARPPGPCRTPAQVSAWRVSCESSCSALEHAGGLSVDKERVGAGDKLIVDKVTQSGTEYVQTLNACVFSNSKDATCRSVIKGASERGLWCEDGK